MYYGIQILALWESIKYCVFEDHGLSSLCIQDLSLNNLIKT
uniref:Mitogen-activated protein kinase kinase kinase 13 n=1 Tax=Rhinopithecus roxellana TaxID=61622 RepID=A0A2K6R5V9_RHIRO